MRASDLHIKRHFTRRVICHRPWIVVVRPEFGVVVVFADIVNFVFRLYVAVFGDTQIHTHPRAVDRLHVDPRIDRSFSTTVNCD